MNISREEKKLEAIKRMRKLRIWNEAIRSFKDKDLVLVTEPPVGAVYSLEDDLKAEVEKFEAEHNALVYMVVRAFFKEFGKMDSLLFVSDYPEEWEMDNEDLEDGYVLSYTINYAWPDCSEMGSIIVRPTVAGGLERIG